MSEIVELAQEWITGVWKACYVVAVVALGFYAVSRGRKAAAVELAEETEKARDRRAA